MLKDKIGETYEYEGITYTVGQKIRGAECSEYGNLIGVIKEICDDDVCIEIICNFEDPTEPQLIKKMEDFYTEVFGKPMTLNDICLDEVIMSPNEVELLSEE